MSREIEDIYVLIAVRDHEFLIRFEPAPDPEADFQFHLCRQQVTLGKTEIDQFWMPIPSLYGQRGTSAVNQQPLVDLWWRFCGIAGTQTEIDVQESYLLAKILPEARSNGSRRVFADAVEISTRSRRHEIQAWAEELNELLIGDGKAKYNEARFHKATECLGHPEYPSSVWEKYVEMTEHLFADAGSRIGQEPTDTVKSVREEWKRLMKGIGRTSGRAVEKTVLDILSYECRAALHRCYSAVWDVLLPQLVARYDMTDESYRFHRLWHFDHCEPSNERNDANFHMFHGHIFGLHPAFGPVLLAPRGREIVGEYLSDCTSRRAYTRLLNALAVAAFFYSGKHDDRKELRKVERVETANPDLSNWADALAQKEQEEFDKKKW